MPWQTLAYFFYRSAARHAFHRMFRRVLYPRDAAISMMRCTCGIADVSQGRRRRRGGHRRLGRHPRAGMVDPRDLPSFAEIVRAARQALPAASSSDAVLADDCGVGAGLADRDRCRRCGRHRAGACCRGLKSRRGRCSNSCAQFPRSRLSRSRLLVLGIGLQMQLFMIAFASVWPVLFSTKAGVEGVDPRFLETGRVFRLGRTCSGVSHRAAERAALGRDRHPHRIRDRARSRDHRRDAHRPPRHWLLHRECSPQRPDHRDVGRDPCHRHSRLSGQHSVHDTRTARALPWSPENRDR